MNRLPIIAIVLWVITILGAAIFFVKGSTKIASDNRQAVILTSAEKDMVLAEMRTMLTAVNGVLKTSSENNWEEAKKAALGAGKAMAVDATPGLVAKLPIEFKSLGMSVHDDFDVLAEDIEKGITQAQILARLGQITNKCIACHANYRFAEGQ